MRWRFYNLLIKLKRKKRWVEAIKMSLWRIPMLTLHHTTIHSSRVVPLMTTMQQHTSSQAHLSAWIKPHRTTRAHQHNNPSNHQLNHTRLHPCIKQLQSDPLNPPKLHRNRMSCSRAIILTSRRLIKVWNSQIWRLAVWRKPSKKSWCDRRSSSRHTSVRQPWTRRCQVRWLTRHGLP